MKKSEVLKQLIEEEQENLQRAELSVSNAFHVRDIIRNTLAGYQAKLKIAEQEEEPKKK